MCGFVFQYDEQTSHEYALNRISSALDAISHRGPDDLQTAYSESAYFAHARLSILDLSASKQPMHSSDGRYTLLFNGEIYNFRELKSHLVDRWQFRTSGDTETLLAGLILEGTDFLTSLEGMWAFALWDSMDKVLMLSRDRMGKKPLYFTEGYNTFGCASELSALKAISEAEWSEDIDSTADYFRYGFCVPGFTMFNDVYEVRPAHYLIWKPGEPVIEKPYWSLNALTHYTHSYTDDDLRNALNDATKKRLVADVEVGGFLSGGIDSSLVCATAQSLIPTRLKTYTIGFSEASFDESNYAAVMAREIGSDHHCETFHSWDENHLEALLSHHVGQPYADASLLPTSMVCKRAAQDVKVVLSGDGADELFGGYQRYQARIILSWYTRLPKALRALAEDAIKHLPTPMVHHSRSLVKKARLFVDAAERHQNEPQYTGPNLFSSQLYESLFPELRGKGHGMFGLEGETSLSDLQRMLFSDCLFYLPQDILTKVDRASMAHSLEVRSPFLDTKLIEIAFSREAAHHIGIGRGKRWLRSAFADQLPGWVWKRRKQGFGVPLSKWFCGDLGDRLLSLLDVQSALVEKEGVRTMLRKHRAGKSDYSMGLWAIYVYLSVMHD